MALGNKLKVTLLTFCAMLVSQSILAADNFNLREGATELSHEVHDLHMMILYICAVIAALVFGTMFYSMWKHTKKKGHVAATFTHSTKAEIIWTTIPFVILIGLAIPATRTLLHMEDNSKSDVNILITGHQWFWEYKYMDGDAEGIHFNSNLSTPKDQIYGVDSDNSGVKNYPQKSDNYLLEVDNPLVLPAGKKIRFLVTAKNVIHAWFMPDFAIKQDAVPGFINEAWAKIPEPGIYRGQCAELCGKGHGFMPIVVVVKSEADYAKWITEQKAAAAKAAADAKAAAASSWSMADLMSKGEEIFNTKCSACHGAKGEGMGPFPALDGSKIATGDVNAHINIVIHGGKAGMPAWKGILTDAEIAAVITFERNSWSNKTGDLVQPAELANK